MDSLVFYIAIAVIGGIVLRKFRKSISERSGESSGKSLKGLFSSSSKMVKKDKSGEQLRAELLNKIDSKIIYCREQFNTYLTQLHTGAMLINSSKKKTEENVAKFRMEALEHKGLYDKDGDELDKTKAMQYLKHLNNAESSLVILKQRGKEILEKLESTEFEQEDYIASLEHKKIEIISEIDPASNFKQAEFSIVELEKELDDKIKGQSIENKANERISRMENDDEFSDGDLESAFSNLK